MKTMKIQSVLFLVITFLFCNFTLEAKNNKDDLYVSSMQKALNQLDNAGSAEQLAEVRNLFERIAGKYQSSWQPVYYVAYCDIQMVYADSKSNLNKVRLEEAKEQLEKLESLAGVDRSELHTLWGYYYNAEIVINPANGQSVFGQVIASYEKAIEENPENPRPVILRAFFNQFLPDFVQLKINPEEEVRKAKDLFAKEEKSIDKPYWGEFYMNMVKTN